VRTSFRATQNAVDSEALLTWDEYVTLYQQRVQRRSRWGAVCLFLLAVTLITSLFGSSWNARRVVASHSRTTHSVARLATRTGLK
jgi:hypothetical protein